MKRVYHESSGLTYQQKEDHQKGGETADSRLHRGNISEHQSTSRRKRRNNVAGD